jgi:RHS repeat-associated protein
MNDSIGPSIRPFQFDDGIVGVLKNSVNLYRGQVTLPFPLLTLSGRNGLSVSLRAAYQGVTSSQATTWNMDAATSVFGLGWLLALEQVVAVPSGDAAQATTSYLLATGGQQKLLIPSGVPNEYVAQDYEFWKIVFDPHGNSWTVLRENGDVYIYGGVDGFIETGVRWGNWTGGSVQGGGTTFPMAWNLRSISNVWGDSIAFAYEYDQVALGASAASYTRSSRLKSITDSYGRRVTLNYADKTETATIHEVQLPHVDPNGSAVQAFQDRYETKYLTSIEVANVAGQTLFDILFSSSLRNFADPNDPNLYKRCLDAINIQYPGAAPEPGFEFLYNSAGTLAPGSLQSVSYPGGGIASYVYGTVGLENAPVIQPVDDQPGVPRVWFGQDYVVFTYQGDSGLTIAIYDWDGGWSKVPVSSLSAPASVGDLRVVTGLGFFAIYYQGIRQQGTVNCHIFVKDPFRPDHWFVNEMNQTVDRVVVGRNCVIAHIVDSTQVVLYQVAGSQLLQQSSFTLPASEIALAGFGTSFATLAYDPGSKHASVGLLAQGAGGNWSYRTCQTISDLYWDTWVLDSFWSVGSDFAAATFISSDEQTYTVALLQWDQSVSSPKWQVLGNYPVPGEQGVPFAISEVAENVIGNSTHLWRFDSGELVPQEFAPLPSTPPPAGGHVARLAYGQDIAVLATLRDSVSHYDLAIYNPYQTEWLPPRLQGTAPAASDGPYPATVGTEYLTIGMGIYFRGAQSGWQSVQGASLGDSVNLNSVKNLSPQFLLSEDNAGKATNLVLLKNGKATSIGGRSFMTIQNQRCYVTSGSGERPGTILAGPRAFVTYNASAPFGDGSSLTLYRVVDETMDTRQLFATTTVIKGLVFSDGAQKRETVYDYNETNVGNSSTRVARGATYDIAGRIAQFAKVTASDGIPVSSIGGTQAIQPPCGSTVKYFLNGIAPEDRGVFYLPDDPYSNARSYPSLMNGLLVAQQELDSEGRPVRVTLNSWQVFSLPFQNLTATYMKQRRSLQASECTPVFNLPAQPADVDMLDQGRVPSSIASELTAAAMSLGSSVTVIVAEGSTNWLILDDTNDRAFPVAKNAGALTLEVFASVRSTTLMDYNAVNGMVASQRISNCDANGANQWKITETLYLCDVLPDIAKSLHLLGPAVQTSTSHQGLTPGSVSQYTGATATVWWPWTHSADSTAWLPAPQFGVSGPIAPQITFAWLGPDPTTPNAPPRFDAWTSGQPDPARWRRNSTVTRRSAHGLPTEKVSLDGVTSSYVYDRYEFQPIVRFTNASASAGEVSYFGFDPNETNPGWTVNHESPSAYTGDAHTGQQCYQLSGGGAFTLSYAFRPRRPRQYLFSCWVKTAKGFGASGEASWTFITSNGHPAAPALTLPNTSGKWIYLFRMIDLSEYMPGSVPEIAVAATNGTGDTVLIDNLRLSPFHAAFSASVLDPRTTVVTATLASNGETTQYIVDYAQQSIGTVGPETSGNWTSRYLWKSELLASDPARPNAVLCVAARTQALYGNFRPATWQEYWTAGNPSAWQVNDRSLTFQGNAPDTLTLNQGLPAGAFAIRLQASPPPSITSPIVLDLGGAITIMLQPGNTSATWALNDRSGGPAPSPVRNPRPGTVDWCLVASGSALVFFVGGTRIFSYIGAQPISGPIRLTVGQVGVVLRDLVVCIDPIVSRTFLDADNRRMQSHALDGEHEIVSQSLYDSVGRPAVVTKAAHLAPNGDNPLLGYRQGFAEMDWSGGPLKGEVATYYSSVNPEAPSDDQGYPFTRTVFEASPLGRPAEVGIPGLAYAITSQRGAHTTKYVYGVNLSSSPGAALGLPIGQHALASRTDQDDVLSFSLQDKTGTLLATATALESGRLSITAMRYDGAGDLVVSRPPTAFAPPNGQVPNTFISTQTYDFEHNLLRATTADGLTTEYIRDPAGRLRFMQDARGRKEGYFCYWIYDELRRVVESGYLAEPWDSVTLSRYAKNLSLLTGQPDWPTPDLTAKTWSKRLVYDGDGTQPNSIGNLWQAQISDGVTGSVDAEETFSYDASEHVLRYALRRAGLSNTPGSVSYTYDAVDNLVGLVADGGLTVAYQFDAMSRLVGVGTSPADPYRYASFRYYPSGQIAQEELNSGRIQIPIAYNSSGRPIRIGGPGSPYVETLGYETHSDHSAGYYNGRIATSSDTFQTLGAPNGFTFDYTYDHLGQLLVARCSQTDWSIGDKSPVSYDPNGNILGFQVGASNQSYRYQGNQVEEITEESSSGAQWSFGYEPNGAINRSDHKGLGLSYDRCTQMPISAQVGTDSTVTYRYDPSLRRIAESVTKGGVTSMRLTTYGIDNNPLIETTSVGSSAPTQLAYVYGPSGLLAVEAASTYFVLSDHLGSSRLLLDEEGQVVAGYDYLPFGSLSRSYGPKVDLLSARYTGQRWDAATGLYNYHARLYDPDLRRFYSRDPAGQYASPYLYVGNNPISLVDPTGMLSDTGWRDRIFSFIIGAAEVITGIVLDVFVDFISLGAAIGLDLIIGGLIGAGLGAVAYTFTSKDDIGESKWWIGFLEQQGIGAALGVASAGFADIGGLAFESLQSAATAATSAVRSAALSAASYGAEATINAVGGSIVNGLGQLAQNYATGAEKTDDLATAFTVGALTGALGSSAGRFITTKFNPSQLPKLVQFSPKWVARRAVLGFGTGFVLSLSGQLITDKLENKEDWDASFWTSVISGAALGAISALPKRGAWNYKYGELPTSPAQAAPSPPSYIELEDLSP